MELVMAPLLAITDDLFRNVYQKHFPYFDYAIAPFISVSDHNKLTKKTFLDLDPVNQKMSLVPQLLNNNKESFLKASKFLLNWGYHEINLNLACPAKTIINKKRGAGLLNQPDQIDRILDDIFSNFDKQELSVKLRSGRFHHTEFPALIKVLNRYPIKKIILHPRTAQQMYNDKVNLDIFTEAVTDLHHQITYSGDIFSKEDFTRLQKRFPTINSWMLGRGILINPLLPWLIKGGGPELSYKNKLITWYNDLFSAFEQYSNNDYYVLGRMKNIWKYLATNFTNHDQILAKLLPLMNKEEFYHASLDYLNNNIKKD